jgi:hypothetical protein
MLASAVVVCHPEDDEGTHLTQVICSFKYFVASIDAERTFGMGDQRSRPND